jgi:hypothetical protein
VAGLAAFLLGGLAPAQSPGLYPDASYSRWNSPTTQAPSWSPPIFATSGSTPATPARPLPPPAASNPLTPAVALSAPVLNRPTAPVLGPPAIWSRPRSTPAVAPAGPGPVSPDGILPTAWPPEPQTGPGDVPTVPIQTEPPGLEVLASVVQTDQSLQERIRQENRERTGVRAEFPPDPVLSEQRYGGRRWGPLNMHVAPYYVAHNRLLFQQINFERYGWDLGPITPIVCAGMFLFDFVTVPYNVFKAPCRCYETNLGYCLPGDPVPLMLYPPEWSLTGLAGEVGAILTLVAIFP